MSLTPTRQAEAQDVVRTVEELPRGELLELAQDALGDARGVEGVEGLARRESGALEEPLAATAEALIALRLEELEESDERELMTRLLETLDGLLSEGGQLERGE